MAKKTKAPKIGTFDIGIGTGDKGKTIRDLPQVANTKSVARDMSRTAKLPGLRISKNGKKYWETRSNRSDKRGSNL